ncbi:MAG: ribosome recycling factor [Parachlamydia sp.]|jgi:ribosome recycling factor|nr:ribosome recycling factor [Parachlamydia sp.]
MSILDQTKSKMAAAIEHLKTNLKNIRTGRANPGMVENVSLEIYGSSMRLKDVAAISTPEPRQLLITPFDPQNVNGVAKGIERANLGLMPIVDGHAVRINIPQMTEEIRKKMAKMCHDEREQTKVSIRNIRREANEAARKQKADGDIAEDAMKKLEKNIQELTDKHCSEADSLAEKKEKEISTI